jgi:signal transduction histidine kinase
MKLSAYSLKTGIFATLVIILFLAMILLDIVVICLYDIPFSHPYQKIVLFYILLNTLFLALFGFYLIYRSTIRPINRLVKRAEEFKEGDTFFLTSSAEQNEFGKLSSSLNVMLRRLEDNKAELKTSISSLEKANLELQQAQEEIIRSEKLASVGRLASGVAHEIGNPIGIVLGYLGLLKGSDLNDEEMQDFINRIEKEINRIKYLFIKLLATW